MGRAEKRRQAVHQRRTGRRMTGVVVLGLLLGSGVVLYSGQLAKADGHIYVAGTDGGGLALRTEPSTNSDVHWYLADGETTNFKCYIHGEYIAGANNTDVWFKVWYARQDGSFQEGFISAAYTTATADDLANLPASWNISDCGGSQGNSQPEQRRAADTPDSAPAGRNFGPDHGSIEAVEDGANSRVTFRFSLTQKQIDNIRSFGTGGEYLEVDFTLRGYEFPTTGGLLSRNGWDDYSIESDLPGAVKDVAFEDTNSWVQHPAATGVKTSSLEANRQYFVTMRWDAGRLKRSPQAPAVNLSWSRGHWARDNSLKERTSCHVAGSHSGNSVGWCVFPEWGYSIIQAAEVAKDQPLYRDYADGFVPLGQGGNTTTYIF